ncbi:hypothetical protein [Paracoccus aerodenitrificans]|uniref:hypothetical protein n=1 Tax=Paracoccus aerodenitrificans TaxID=3017781 RepID=UPI0022F143A4|nr:hypothetical protein [Paracoccus aerodenitrificans]WBU63092.1 hypothetical protein PAE61_12050 [Paracoccus aerodenitrificans]
MRLILSLGAVSLALAGCVAPVTTQPTAPIVNPPVTQPPPPTNTLDSSTRSVARDVINREMAKRLPGRNVGPITDCVVNGASMAELTDIAARGVNDSASAAASVAVIVAREPAKGCIGRAAQLG